MPIALQKVQYESLTSKQQESYNFQKVSAVLADYGYTTIRLTDDWQGADFVAQHRDGQTFLKVQLKGRLTFDKKYENKSISVVFPYKGKWFIYEHDELLKVAFNAGIVENSKSWTEGGDYSFASISKELLSSPCLVEL